MSNTFEFNGVVLKCAEPTIGCNGCYFEKQSLRLCIEQQETGLVPDCTTDDLYIFVEVKQVNEDVYVKDNE